MKSRDLSRVIIIGMVIEIRRARSGRNATHLESLFNRGRKPKQVYNGWRFSRTRFTKLKPAHSLRLDQEIDLTHTRTSSFLHYTTHRSHCL